MASESSFAAWYGSRAEDEKKWRFAIANLCLTLQSDTVTYKLMQEGDLSDYGASNWWSGGQKSQELSSQLGSSVEAFALHSLANRFTASGNVGAKVQGEQPDLDNSKKTRSALGEYVANSIADVLDNDSEFIFDDLQAQGKNGELKFEEAYNVYADWVVIQKGVHLIGELKTKWAPKKGRTLEIDPTALVQCHQQARFYREKKDKNAQPMLVYMCCPFPGTAARVAIFMPSILSERVLEVGSENPDLFNKTDSDRCYQLAVTIVNGLSVPEKAQVLEDLAKSPAELGVLPPAASPDEAFTCGSDAKLRVAIELSRAVALLCSLP